MNDTNERITVPATLPGVVRPFTPLLPPEGDKSFGDYIRGCAVSAITDTEDINGDPAPPELSGDIVWLYQTSRETTLPCACDSVHLKGWMVDLEDATGRAHVAWAIAGGVCGWRLSGFAGNVEMTFDGVGVGECYGSDPAHCIDSMLIPALSGLDINDDTRLPDGSRRVDALALRAVALHVLGGAS